MAQTTIIVKCQPICRFRLLIPYLVPKVLGRHNEKYQTCRSCAQCTSCPVYFKLVIKVFFFFCRGVDCLQQSICDCANASSRRHWSFVSPNLQQSAAHCRHAFAPTFALESPVTARMPISSSIPTTAGTCHAAIGCRPGYKHIGTGL